MSEARRIVDVLGKGDGGPQHFLNPPLGAGENLEAQDGWWGAAQTGHNIVLVTFALDLHT